jgi:hypothetical protein
VHLVLVLLAVLAPFWMPAPLESVALAREIDVVGTVDCGRPSGARCSIDDVVSLLTEGPGGRIRTTVDVSWVKRDLPALDQDDVLCLLVESRPGGTDQAIGLVEPCGNKGTDNPGRSTGSRRVAEQPKPSQEDDSPNNGNGLFVPTDTDDVILSWTAPTADLDIHMSGPLLNGGRFHLYFLNEQTRNPAPHVSLVSDALSGPGQERIIIRRDPTTADFVPGEYRVWVNNFNGLPPFTATGAILNVLDHGASVGQFAAVNATGDPTEELWHVVNLTLDRNGKITLTSVQQFKDGDVFTVLCPGCPPPGRK